MAGRAFTYNGRSLVAYRNTDEDSFRTSLMQLDAMGEEDSPFPVPEACSDLYLQLWQRAADLVAASFLLNAAESNVVDASRVPTYVPGDGYAQLDAWLADPELAAVVAYAPEGLVVEAAEAVVLEEILSGVSSIQSGRCAWRIRWGLVGTVALLGAAVLGGGAIIYANRKRRR